MVEMRKWYFPFFFGIKKWVSLYGPLGGSNSPLKTLCAIIWQLERLREDIDVAIQNLDELRDANTGYSGPAANLCGEDLQISDLALVHETKIEQSHGAKLDARWRGPYRVTDIAQSLGTDQLAELDGAEREGWIDGSRLNEFFTCHEGVNGGRELSSPDTAPAVEW